MKLFLLLLCFSLSYGDIVWTKPITVKSSPGKNLKMPCLSLHPTNRSAAILWIEDDGKNYTIQGGGFNGSCWTPTTNLGSSTKLPRYQLKMNRHGVALGTWHEYREKRLSLRFCFFNGLSWFSPGTIAKLGPSYYNPFLSSDYNAAGIGAISWRDSEGNICVKIYQPSSWGNPHRLNVGELIGALPAPIKLHSANAFFSALFAKDGIYTCSKSCIPNNAPIHAKITSSSSSFLEPKMVNNPAKDQIAIAFQSADSLLIALNFRPHTKERSWRIITLKKDIEDNPALNLNLALNPNNAHLAVIWQLSSGLIEAGVFDGNQWTAISTLATNAESPTLAFNPVNDHAIALWADLSKGNAQNTIQFSEWNGTDWSSPSPLCEKSSLVGAPAIDIDSNGNALALWHRSLEGVTVIEAAFSTHR